MELMNITFIVIGSIVFLVLVVKQIINFFYHSEGTKIEPVDVASAGSSIPQNPQQIMTSSASLNKLKTGNKESRCYRKFWIKGWSMLLCGIRNDDILFTEEINPDTIDTLTFEQPIVLVLKREGKSLDKAIAKGDYAKYKVRRTWAMLPFDEEKIMAEVKKIMDGSTFKQLQTDYPKSFYSKEKMETDCRETRIKNYKAEYQDCEQQSSPNNLVIISTTLRKIEGESKVFFSIHPARIIVGKAVYTFHKKEEETHMS